MATLTLYALKPHFQGLLRPLVAALPRMGITANAVTIVAALGSVVVALVTLSFARSGWVFLSIPVWMLIRMALNAIDGMLAREFSQKSVLGGYLNEMGDVVSDAALYVPFGLFAPIGWVGIALIIFMSVLTEFAGVLGVSTGGSRRYEGPMGKSDRAVVFGALGLWIGLSLPLPALLRWAVPLLLALLLITAINRIRAGMAEAERIVC
jgi:CDP-diacylglycerol---glycerol-3-phosphate 3-phosphatidyltransferase